MRKILIGTFFIEGVGAILLSIRFCGELGFVRGVYYGIFHSISAFCNAGFDLMGYQGAYNSMVNYSGDWLVNLTLVVLILTGGIGFLVWDDITRNGLHFKKYMVHTKIVLTTSAVLVVGGTFLFYLFERNNLASGMGAGETFLTCLFDAVTPRTAGFNTTDIAQLTDASKMLTVILMFIGGCPGSTAGGIKTTTFLVMILYVRASIKRTRGVNIFKRRLDDDSIKRASAVACTNLTLALIATLVICGNQSLDLRDVMLETFSAMSTVGMSTGITRELTVISQITIIFLMYAGRVGSLSMALSFTEKKKTSPYELPEEKILIG
jgi:trk system potassium uptake protein TrkH